MNKGNVLILGARSDIAMAVAYRYAESGHHLQLAARNVNSLERDKSNIEIRYGMNVSLHEFDVLETYEHDGFVNNLETLPDIALCAVGVLGEQLKSEKDMEELTLVLRSNFEGPAAILSVIANKFEERGSGVIIGISSVAGERGRVSNYIYGSSKAGFTAYLSGLRNRLAGKNVHVLTVLPGFVATKMTEGLDLPPRLTSNPKEVASAIVKAVEKKKNVLYVKPIWALIMIVIRMIPENLFKKMKL